MASPGQFIEQSMLSGFQQGAAQKDAHKDYLWEQGIHQKTAEYADNLKGLQTKIATLQKGTPEWNDTHNAIVKTLTDSAQLLHPQKSPGMLHKYGHMITDALKITKPQPTDTMAVPSAAGLVEPGNIRIWNRPAIDNGDGTHSSEYSVSFKDENGHEVLVPTIVNGKFLTPDGKKPPVGSDQEKAMFTAAWQHYLQTGESLGKFASEKDADNYANILHSRGATPKGIAKQEVKQDQKKAGFESEAKGIEAAGPLSPEQQAVQQAQAASAGGVVQIKAGQQEFLRENPNATPEEQTENFNMLRDRFMGGRATSESFGTPVTLTLADGRQISAQHDSKSGKWYDLNRDPIDPTLLATAKIPAKPTLAGVEIDQYNKGLADGTIPAGTSMPQWISQQRQSSAALQQWVMAQYGKDLFQLSPEQADQAILRYKQLTTPSVTTTRDTPVYDQNGQLHVFKGTSTSSKNFTGTGDSAPTLPRTTTQAKSNNTNTNSSSPKTPPSPVGPGLDFYKATPDYSTAKKEWEDAIFLDSIAVQVQGHPKDAVNQKRLAVMLEKQAAGRFTTQALDYVIKAGWGNTIEQWANNPTTGALPSDIVRQLVEGAHQNLRGSKDRLDAAKAGGSDTKRPGAAKPPGATHKIEYPRGSGTWYYTDKDGNNLGEVPK